MSTEPSASVVETVAPAPDIQHFIPYCMVCREPLPRGRWKYSTCCKEHAKTYRAWRDHIKFQRVCPGCNAPYTEKQRAEFKAWRKATGQLRAKAGRPARPPAAATAAPQSEQAPETAVEKTVDSSGAL